jgi:dTDP-4-amino-4,6-dideoxygalactose transaminase
MIPVFKPLLGDSEKNAACNVLDVGWLGMGKHVGDFESQVSNYLGLQNKYAVAVSTGHAALHLALILMGVGEGDEVITPSFNNVADFQAILACGAKPVFCDVLDETLCIDVEKAEKLITEKTKVIIVMDYDCHLCDHEKINEIASKYKLRVLHDAAHSFGSKYKGKKVGTFSDITMFSFDPVKTITCLDGGMLVVNSKEEVRLLHEMRLVGMTQPSSTMYQNQRAWTYDVEKLGFRYHMSNMHAAIGISQLGKIEVIERSRKKTCEIYSIELSKIEGVKVPLFDFTEVVPFLYYIRVDQGIRDALREYLFKHGIDNGIHWQPGHSFSLFKNCRSGDLSVTDRLSAEILSLPLHSLMNSEDQVAVINTIKDFFKMQKVN